MEQMYAGMPFSPITNLANNIGVGETVIPVIDTSVFLQGPNLATIGTDENAETIRYAAVITNALSGCTRGIEGEAKAWPMDTPIARNFTAYDLQLLITNILSSVQRVPGNASDIFFFDNENFQDKYNTGQLTGPIGPQGLVGPQGEIGPPGNVMFAWIKSDPLTGIITQYNDEGYTGPNFEFNPFSGFIYVIKGGT